jgi:hypothetical protein
MKDRTTFTIRRAATGEVTAEIINERGEIVSSKSFGIMCEREYLQIMKLIEQEFPDIGQIDLIGLERN